MSSSTLDQASQHAVKQSEVDERALGPDPTYEDKRSASHSDEDRGGAISDEKRAPISDEEKGETKAGPPPPPPGGPPPLDLPPEAYWTLAGGFIALFCSFG